MKERKKNEAEKSEFVYSEFFLSVKLWLRRNHIERDDLDELELVLEIIINKYVLWLRGACHVMEIQKVTIPSKQFQLNFSIINKNFSRIKLDLCNKS